MHFHSGSATAPVAQDTALSVETCREAKLTSPVVESLLLCKNPDDIDSAVKSLPPRGSQERSSIIDYVERCFTRDIHVNFGLTPDAFAIMQRIREIESLPAKISKRHKTVFNRCARKVSDDLYTLAKMCIFLRKEKGYFLDPLLGEMADEFDKLEKSKSKSAYAYARAIASVMSAHYGLDSKNYAPRKPVHSHSDSEGTRLGR